jgi:general nucleoside transport system ATP-binding protein
VCPWNSVTPGVIAADVAAGAPEVRLEGIRRIYGATVANDSVDLHLRPGSIHALVGENGAGKSTLMRILYGLVHADAGTILIDGRPRAIRSPADALGHGIGMIHQHFMLVPPMTVLENVVLGYPGLRGLRRIPREALAGRLADLCERYGLALDPGARVADLGVGEQQRVEIARLLFHGARVLICDEPTAVLAPPEVAGLFSILRRFRAEGRTIVLITHKLGEVLDVADRVTVLRRGRVVGEAERSGFDREQMIAWIMGSAAAPAGAGVRARAPVRAGLALEARGIGLTAGDGTQRLSGITLALHEGEIVGIAGVQGNGQRELAVALSGRARFDSGELRIGAARIAAGGVMPARLRPALVPEDRTSEGLIGSMPLWENLLLGHFTQPGRRWRRGYRHAAVKAWARPRLVRFRVEPDDPELMAAALSGGNQQKLLCAREFDRSARVLVAAQPTRGIDLASTAFLHERLREFRDGGGSVLLISADLDEIFALADRIAVLYRGRLTLPLARASLDLETVGRAMVGMPGAWPAAEAGEPRV